MSKSFPAPAKINRHLRVIKKRDDGYHEIDTSFQFLDFADTLTLEVTNDKTITRIDQHDFELPEKDLCIQVATLLQTISNTTHGVNITLTKVIPPGTGLGGGSSNAATTLLALNDLWNINLPREKLIELGLQLGADVSIFLFGNAARATGIGEKLALDNPPEKWICLFLPEVTVSTKQVFSRWDGQTPPDNIQNDLEPITAALYPEVATALNQIRQHTDAQMSGSGSAIFAECESREEAKKLAATIKTPSIITHTRNVHPI